VYSTWKEAREAAQQSANRTGYSHGVMKNALGTWSVCMLPPVERRSGSELRCEVVDPYPREEKR
jgi:hypothetical protein